MYILNEKTGTLHLKNACCHAHDGMHRSHFRTEQEAKENYDAYTGAYGGGADIIGENELMYSLTATQSAETFPKSKKLYELEKFLLLSTST